MKKKILILIIIMTTIWGLLTKSLIDNETIEQAINRLILAHNNDETAHLAVGQSLQSHKASEIIDHLAGSIISDKIEDFEVGREKLSLNKVYIRPTFENMDNWQAPAYPLTQPYIGAVALTTTSVANNEQWLVSPADILFLSWNNKNVSFEAVIELSHLTDCVYYWGTGDPDGHFFGFKFEDGLLFAYWTKQGIPYTEEITGYNLSQKHAFHAFKKLNLTIDFYIDGELKHTANSNIPSADETLSSLSFYVKTKINAWRRIIICGTVYSQDV